MFRSSGLLALAVALLFISPALAQTTTAAITGTVIDASGAFVPNVKVTATNTATNVANASRTNDAGVFTFPFLTVGEYTVSAEAQGFKRTVLGPFRLEVNQIARIDPKLEIGQMTESVQISDVAPVLQTESTQTGGVLSSTKLTQLPLNGAQLRNAKSAGAGRHLYEPAEHVPPAGASRTRAAAPMSMVIASRPTIFFLTASTPTIPSTIVSATSPTWDALEEVKVLTVQCPGRVRKCWQERSSMRRSRAAPTISGAMRLSFYETKKTGRQTISSTTNPALPNARSGATFSAARSAARSQRQQGLLLHGLRGHAPGR